MLVFLLSFVFGSADGHIPAFWLLLSVPGVGIVSVLGWYEAYPKAPSI